MQATDSLIEWSGTSRSTVGICERFIHGVTIGAPYSGCRNRGLDAPQFEEIGTHFRVTLSAVARSAPAKDARDEKILAVLAENIEAGLSTSQIAERLELSPRATRTRLVSLVERGLIVEIGSGPQDPHRRYHLITGVR